MNHPISPDLPGHRTLGRGRLGLRAGRGSPPLDVHRQILAIAARQEAARRKRFDAVSTPAQLEELRASLRSGFLEMIDGLPRPQGPPPSRTIGRIAGEGHVVEKLVFESFPGYFVSALLYKPKQVRGRLPGVISPCGHSPVGKAAGTYQILHINLVKRGYIVLTYDPVGQGERSQFWDAAQEQSRFNLACGEHAVLGNPLYLLGTSLARYRIWDGIRALDYLASLPGGRCRADRLRRQLRRRHADRVHRRPRPAREGAGHRLLHHDPAAAHGQSHPGRPRRRPGAGHLRLRQRRHRSRRPARAAAPRGRRCSARPDSISSRSRGPANRSPRPGNSIEVAGAGTGWPGSRPPRSMACRCRCARRPTPASTAGCTGPQWPRPAPEFAVAPRPPADLLRLQRWASQRHLPVAAPAAAGPGGVRSRSRAAPASALRDLLRLDPNGVDFRPSTRPPGPGDAPLVVCVNGNEAPAGRRRASWRPWRRRGHAPSSRSTRAASARCGRPARRATGLRRSAGRRRGEPGLQRLPGRQSPAGDARHRRAGRGAELPPKTGPRPSSCAAGATPPWSRCLTAAASSRGSPRWPWRRCR